MVHCMPGMLKVASSFTIDRLLKTTLPEKGAYTPPVFISGDFHYTSVPKPTHCSGDAVPKYSNHLWVLPT